MMYATLQTNGLNKRNAPPVSGLGLSIGRARDVSQIRRASNLPVQQIDGDTVRADHVSAPDCAHSSVRGQNDDGSESGFKGPVQEGEALDIEHVHLISSGGGQLVTRFSWQRGRAEKNGD